MPHIIVEYSSDLETRLDIPRLLERLHETLAAQGIDKARIKTRGVALNHAVVGNCDLDGSMIHTTFLLLEGRDVALRKRYGEALYTVLKASAAEIEDCAVTLEIREMVKDTYFM